MTKVFSHYYYFSDTLTIVKKLKNMNLLLTIAAVANPVLTALLTILVFLESKKSKKQIEDIQNSINTGNQSIVASVVKQKDDFTKLAESFEALSKDTEESAKSFVEISNALTKSSAVSKEALGKVTSGLENHATLVTGMIDTLTAKVTNTSAESIKGITDKVSAAMDNINDAVSKIETSQNSLKDNLKESISKLSESTDNTNKSINSLQESLKNMVSLNQ